MPDLYLRATNLDGADDLRLYDPTVADAEEPGGMTDSMRYYMCRQTQAWRLGRRMTSRAKK